MAVEDLRAGERVAVGDDKRDPLDFVLWKAAKPDEPDDAKYDGGGPAGYGLGRPGWHIECSAMGCAMLGERFEAHIEEFDPFKAIAFDAQKLGVDSPADAAPMAAVAVGLALRKVGDR
jgi:hypothetical protein